MEYVIELKNVDKEFKVTCDRKYLIIIKNYRSRFMMNKK